MIFGLFGLTTVVNIILVVASRSDGGAQIVPDYYDQAVHWDETQSVRHTSEARGWQLTIDMPTHTDGVLHIQDKNAQPIVGLTADLRLRRPQYADDIAVTILEPVVDAPGSYRFAHPQATAGLWDFVVDGEYEGERLLLSHRTRIR